MHFINHKNVTDTETVTFETVPTIWIHPHCLLSLSSQHFNAVSKETKEHWNSAVKCRRVIGAEGRVVWEQIKGSESTPMISNVCIYNLLSVTNLWPQTAQGVIWYKTSLSTYPCTTTLMVNSRITSSPVKCEWSNLMLQILHLYKCECIHDNSGGIFIRAVCCEESRRENNILAHIQCTVKRNNRNVHIQTHAMKRKAWLHKADTQPPRHI